MFAACCHHEAATEDEQAVRTAKDGAVPPSDALAILKRGNQRYVAGRSTRGKNGAGLRAALADHGQNPMAVVIGCADSRCPLETLFDAQPGDLFVLRNAGNACTHPEGSIVGSVEYAVGALKTKLVVVLGHTKCGAIVGATKTMMSQSTAKHLPKRSISSLESYLTDLAPIAKRAMDTLPAGASVDEIAALAIKVNIFNTIEKLMEYSAPLRKQVESGEIQFHGAVYCIASGEVEWLGQLSTSRSLGA